MVSLETPPAMSGHRRSSLRSALFFESFTLLSITVIGVLIATFFLAGHELRVRTTAQLEFAASSKENFFEMTVSKQREQLSILGRDPLLTTFPSVQNLIGFRELYQIDQAKKATLLSRRSVSPPLTESAILQESETEPWTFFRPIFTDRGWTAYLIVAPQMNSRGQRIGSLVAVFDPMVFAARLLETAYLGKTAQVILVTEQQGELILLHSEEATESPMVSRIPDEARERSIVLWQTLAGKEGAAETVDYSGIPVLMAYRTIPSTRWGIIVQLDRYELFEPIIRLGANLVGSGLILVTLLSLSVFFLARQIVSPLEELARKLNNLEVRRWRFRRSIFTGNELEIVDRAAYNLTRRLREAHDHLEKVVQQRTQALRSQHAQDAAILESIDYGLLVTNRRGQVIYLNKTGELLTGWRLSDSGFPLYTAVLRIVDQNGQDVRTADHPITSVLSTKQRFNPSPDPEFSLKRRNGTLNALHLRATPIMRGRQCIGAVAVFRDITEERRIDHMKSEFISLVSHQLRTPLSSMRWYLEMLMAKDAGPLTGSQQQYVEEVAASNTRMVHLVNALLNVSRLELGKIQLSPETIDVVRLLEEIRGSFKLELERKRMRIDIFPQERATIELRSDRGLLQLILENLLGNAIKYGRETTAVKTRITVNRSRRSATISISDSGIGIPENQQPSIFRKLFRGTNARLSDTEGSGLGLYISHIAAESIGGKLTFKSREGIGATFSLTVPLVSDQTKSADTVSGQ